MTKMTTAAGRATPKSNSTNVAVVDHEGAFRAGSVWLKWLLAICAPARSASRESSMTSHFAQFF